MPEDASEGFQPPVLDTTADESAGTVYATIRTVDLKPFDIDEEREKMRGRIALILVCVFVFTVVATFAMVVLGCRIADIKEILTLILSPLVALVGTATGFYYGGKTQK